MRPRDVRYPARAYPWSVYRVLPPFLGVTFLDRTNPQPTHCGWPAEDAFGSAPVTMYRAISRKGAHGGKDEALPPFRCRGWGATSKRRPGMHKKTRPPNRRGRDLDP
jgi:hypothetical protein